MLVEDGGETVLRPGDSAAFPKSTGNGHHLINRSDTMIVFLEIGTREPDDVATYSDIDMVADADGRFVQKDGSPYPAGDWRGIEAEPRPSRLLSCSKQTPHRVLDSSRNGKCSWPLSRCSCVGEIPMPDRSARHRHGRIDGHRLFLREAGPPDAPVLLLPHGYPCSSFQFRRLMPALADRWRTVAFDWPGFGYSDTPDPASFGYDFDAYENVLTAVTDHLGLDRYALWLHDYGSQIGLRHAIAHPDRVAALIIQNGDIYEDVLGPKYATIKAWWADKSEENHRPLEDAVSEDGFRHEFVGEVSDAIAARVPPDLWKLHWPLMDTPVRRRISVSLMEKLEANLAWFPRYQAYVREHQPPTLIVWGPEDGYMPPEAARAYRRDLPDAELHLIEGAGHWLLETHFEEALALVRDFLERNHGETVSTVVAGPWAAL